MKKNKGNVAENYFVDKFVWLLFRPLIANEC